MSRKYLFFILILFSSNSWAQENVKIFTVDDFLWFVKNYHPVSLQGKLLQKKGENTILSARGAFDPLLYSDLDQKSFDDKKYYNILSGGLKIPSWYGLEFNTGIDQSSGSFLNPENIVPPGGLWYVGISVSLTQGLIIDNRRASLKRAQIYAQSTKAEQQLLMNELYFDAISEYWKWMEAWNQFEVYNQSLTLSLAAPLLH